MTVKDLMDWCYANGVNPMEVQIACRAKDDYFITPQGVYLDTPYFGNSREGEEWIRNNAPRDENGDIDYNHLPDFLILDTFSG